MNLRESQPTGTMSVAELTFAIKSVLETDFDEVLVKGEVSNFKQHTSGHRYFTLKDDGAQISCVMWRSRTLPFDPTDGMSVVVGGSVTVYPARGNYQIDCVFMRPDGVGALYKAYEKLKAELGARGWFDDSRKRPLPRFPQRVGIATSATGAALHDMLTTIQRRYMPLEVVLRPTLVQGDGSAADIARAIRQLDDSEVDVIIIGRGGGSIEDLWSFNTEEVARAIVECNTPIISAVGHETDYTIADFVADRRAPTPTAAAEFVTPFTSNELLQMVDELEDEMTRVVLTRTTDLLDLVADFTQGTALLRIGDRLASISERVHAQSLRQHNAMSRLAGLLRDRLSRTVQLIQSATMRNLQAMTTLVGQLDKRLAALHPNRPLKLGYAIIERNHSPLPVSQPLTLGDVLTIRRWHDAATVLVQHIDHHQPNQDAHGEHHG